MHEHPPQISIWPLVLAFSVTLIVAGILSTWIVSVLGIGLLLYSLWGWTQENRTLSQLSAEPVENEEHPHE